MDPLSISVGILTILGASGKIYIGLEKLRCLKEAPAAFLALNNEIADVEFVVQDVHGLTRGYQDIVGRPITQSVCRALENLKGTLLQLEQIMAYKLTNVDSRTNEVKLRKGAWMQSRRQLEELRRKLWNDRENSGVASTVLTS